MAQERMQLQTAAPQTRPVLTPARKRPVTNTRAQAAGFKIDAYDASSATVDLALNYNTGSLVSLPVKLVWEAGDWKLVLTDSGELPLKPAQLQSLGGYIPWAGA
jgi:hypothetical protein